MAECLFTECGAMARYAGCGFLAVTQEVSGGSDFLAVLSIYCRNKTRAAWDVLVFGDVVAEEGAMLPGL
jgi:hypothetical protein